MSWINEHRRVWGIAILAILLLAGVGPWSFDLIDVPAQYPCSAPFIRLKGDFCGLPLPGMWVLSILPGALVALAVGTLTGELAFADVVRIFLEILSVLFVLLPVISALFLVLPGPLQYKSKLHLAAWGLAVVVIVRWLPLTFEYSPDHLWGLWLYMGVVCSVLILGVVMFTVRCPSKQADRSSAKHGS